MLFLTIILKGISRNFSVIFIHKQKYPATNIWDHCKCELHTSYIHGKRLLISAA